MIGYYNSFDLISTTCDVIKTSRNELTLPSTIPVSFVQGTNPPFLLMGTS